MKERSKVVYVAVPNLSRAHQQQIRGVFRYARKVGWRVEVLDRGPYTAGFEDLREIRSCDGLVVVDLESFARIPVRRRRFPCVLIDCSKSLARTHAHVLNDNAAIGRLAADFLLSRRFATYAYLPVSNRRVGIYGDWSGIRGRAFAAAVKAGGRRFARCPIGRGQQTISDYLRATSGWLAGLPRPVALFAANDRYARLAADAVALTGLRVPDDVAILGVDDDELVCEGNAPTLSSVLVDFEDCGWKAASLLDGLMQGEPSALREKTYGPLSVMRRKSTSEPSATSDWRYTKALEFIRAHFAVGVGLADVAQVLGVSVRTVEYVFAAAGTTVSAAVLDAKFQAAERALISTKEPIGQVALECGFPTPAYFTRLFVRRYGRTPSDFRCAERQE